MSVLRKKSLLKGLSKFEDIPTLYAFLSIVKRVDLSEIFSTSNCSSPTTSPGHFLLVPLEKRYPFEFSENFFANPELLRTFFPVRKQLRAPIMEEKEAATLERMAIQRRFRAC